MLKTTVDRIAKPVLPLLLFGILAGYVERPVIVFMYILGGMKKVEKSIPREYPADLRRICALMISMYRLFREKMDDRQALALVKAVGIPSGLAVQMANFRYVESEHSMENLMLFQQRTNREGPTRMNAMNVYEAADKKYDFAVTGSCCFFKVFASFGMKELTTIFCETDNAIFNLWRPDEIVFSRGGSGRRIVDGADECSFMCRATE